MLVAADMRLLSVDSSAFSAEKGTALIAVRSCIRFVSHASLMVARKAIIETGLSGIKEVYIHLQLYFLHHLRGTA